MRAILVLLILVAAAQAQGKDKRYWLAVAGASAMVAADAYTTISPSFRGPGCDIETGTAWLYGREPQQHPFRTVLLMGGEVSLSGFASHAIRKQRFWIAPLLYSAAIHGQAAARNVYRCR